MDLALRELELGNIFGGMSRLVSELGAVRQRLGPPAWKRFVAATVMPHKVREITHEDPLTYRAFAKPRGYAGDAVMMDYIYGYESAAVDQLSPVARRIFKYSWASPASAAVRFRREVLAETIDAEAERHARDIEVVAVAAGHLREVDLSTAVRTARANVTAFDQDEESLAVVRDDYGRYGVQAIAASVRHLIAGRQALPASDLSYTAGLYDYLPEAAATRLTTLMFDALRPGGTLLIANFLPGIADVGYMESLMDWQLIYRDDADMRRLIGGVPTSAIARLDQFHDPFDNITFLRATKAV